MNRAATQSAPFPTLLLLLLLAPLLPPRQLSLADVGREEAELHRWLPPQRTQRAACVLVKWFRSCVERCCRWRSCVRCRVYLFCARFINRPESGPGRFCATLTLSASVSVRPPHRYRQAFPPPPLTVLLKIGKVFTFETFCSLPVFLLYTCLARSPLTP